MIQLPSPSYILNNVPPQPYNSNDNQWLSLIYAALYNLQNINIMSNFVKTVKLDLTAEQIKNANTTPIAIAIPSSANVYIEPVSSKLVMPTWGIAFTSSSIFITDNQGLQNVVFNQLDLTTPAVYNLIGRPGADTPNTSGTNSTTLFVKTDADSLVGNGTATIYLQYLEINISDGTINA